MDPYRCAYRDPSSPLTPIKPINTHFQYGTTPLSSRTPESTKAMEKSTQYYTLIPQRNVSKTTNQDCGKNVYRKVTRREVLYHRGKVVSRREEKITFKKSTPTPRPLCPKVAEWLRSIGLQKLQPLFKDQEIDYKALLLMDENDLKYLGIQCPCERGQLLNLIRRKKDYWNFC